MIEVNNLTSKKIDLNRVRSIILETLRLEKRVDDKEVSVAIVNSYEIEKINSKYRNINQPTDVLSFEGGDDILGEIIICPDEVQKNGENFDDEFCTKIHTKSDSRNLLGAAACYDLLNSIYFLVWVFVTYPKVPDEFQSPYLGLLKNLHHYMTNSRHCRLHACSFLQH